MERVERIKLSSAEWKSAIIIIIRHSHINGGATWPRSRNCRVTAEYVAHLHHRSKKQILNRVGVEPTDISLHPQCSRFTSLRICPYKVTLLVFPYMGFEPMLPSGRGRPKPLDEYDTDNNYGHSNIFASMSLTVFIMINGSAYGVRSRVFRVKT